MRGTATVITDGVVHRRSMSSIKYVGQQRRHSLTADLTRRITMPRRRIPRIPIPHRSDRRRSGGNAIDAQRPPRRRGESERIAAAHGCLGWMRQSSQRANSPDRWASTRRGSPPSASCSASWSIEQLEELAAESQALVDKAMAMVKANASPMLIGVSPSSAVVVVDVATGEPDQRDAAGAEPQTPTP